MTETNPGALPYGCGSMHMRRKYWWVVYRDEQGRRVQMNTWSKNMLEARRFLIEEATRIAKWRLARLREIADETSAAIRSAGREQPANDDSGHGESPRPVRQNSPRTGKRAQKTGGRA